jgi:hypothetical protein
MYITTPEEFASIVTIGSTTENLTLDFKTTIDHSFPRGTPDDVKQKAQQEICRDIAQFANTDGGCLLIGVEEDLDPVTGLKVAKAISSVTEPDEMKQWIEEAVKNYLVPGTLRHPIDIVRLPSGTVVAVNVPPSLHLVALWLSERKSGTEKHRIEYLYRDSHGKKWMNPDEVERHIMNGSRAAKLAFERALDQATTGEVRVAGGYWQRVGNPPNTTLQPWYPDHPVTIGRVADQWFELEFKVGPNPRSLILPFGVVQEAWVGADEKVHILLSVRAVHVYAANEFTVEPWSDQQSRHEP